jgi:hypothetical protein
MYGLKRSGWLYLFTNFYVWSSLHQFQSAHRPVKYVCPRRRVSVCDVFIMCFKINDTTWSCDHGTISVKSIETIALQKALSRLQVI